ncbi:MAG: C45 family autoproteolytic acyltransferase/hydrolase [Planctomycetota bacterium]|nr:C45 family autoproteolytic acyltransferase/hydrolase [Planctomycetota bacterium]
MLQIETTGSWRQMGQQIGEEFRDWFEPIREHFASWLVDDFEKHQPAIAGLRALLLEHCPELNEETEGMAEAVGFESDFMLGLRFFNEIRQFSPGCSGFFITDSDAGPLLARTCDIEPDISQEIQLLRTNRPPDGPDTVLATYLGLTGGVGLNEHGLAMVGSSATPRTAAPPKGLPIAMVNHLMITRCSSLEEVSSLLAAHPVKGKGAVELLSDARGASMMVEFVPGRRPILTPRGEDRSWQACSNFCFSKGLTDRSGPAYLENAYTRYGRMVHQVGEGVMERTLEGVKQLILEISQPGLVCPEEHCFFHTAYSFIVETNSRCMHVCPGHPADNDYFKVRL